MEELEQGIDWPGFMEEEGVPPFDMDEVDDELSLMEDAHRQGRRRRRMRLPYVGFANAEEEMRAGAALMSLSDRELTVLALLAFGFSAKQVANRLQVSGRTVDTFRTRALLKLRARNTADAVRMLATLSVLAELRGGN